MCGAVLGVLKHPDPSPYDPTIARPETGGSSPAGVAELGSLRSPSLRRSRRGSRHCQGRAIYRKTFTPSVPARPPPFRIPLLNRRPFTFVPSPTVERDFPAPSGREGFLPQRRRGLARERSLDSQISADFLETHLRKSAQSADDSQDSPIARRDSAPPR